MEQLKKYWHCLQCNAKAVTYDSAIPMHYCTRGLLPGMATPLMGIDITSAKITVQKREDYLGTELAQSDVDGRPVQAVYVETDHGVDAYAYAPIAQANVDGN